MPRFVSRFTKPEIGTPSRDTESIVAPRGSVCPMTTFLTSPPWTSISVVYRLAVWLAATSTDPFPMRMLSPLTELWPDGTWGTIASSPRPSWGRTPSHWWTTAQAVP